MSSPEKLRSLAARWVEAKAAERANAQSYIIELCDALGVEPPRPAGSGYEFERPVKLTNRDGSESQGFIDCYKADHFVLEAKDYEPAESNDVLLRKAFGQARLYAAHDPVAGIAPPYILVLDVSKVLLVWDRWSGGFGGFPAARKIELTTLDSNPEDVALLVDIWTQPSVRDPRLHSQAVTKDIAAHLAELAASLERRGYQQERVAQFLMRCVFTMFAEDVNLLADKPFYHLLNDVAMANPTEFVGATEELWRAMDKGERFGFRKLLRFNGHFFGDAEALPLTRADLAVLLEAARADWSHVEPAIFGTLLTRALDPIERHRLGAEFTPPEFIEKVIKPTIEEPVRERWTAVQADVVNTLKISKREGERREDFQRREKRLKRKAETKLREFHAFLRTITVLDPACGSGNFLYMAMVALKRIELEVLHSLGEVTESFELRIEEVDPSQFFGIEVKPWAREIAELTLWIGFHQFWGQHHHVQPTEPLLRDTDTLECRDAVLSWREIIHDPTKDRPDPTPRILDPTTGDLVPDPLARLAYMAYQEPGKAPWPQVDFIVGNPPYLGKQKKRKALGDGYVDALQAAYPEIAPASDFVALWWYRASEEVASGRTTRAGLITTNSITQRQNRDVISHAREKGAEVVWAIPDHPWVSEADGAQVRVAMSVIARNPLQAVTITVDDEGNALSERVALRLNSDLSAGADVAAAGRRPLLSNKGLATVGFKPYGEGFVLDAEEAALLLDARPERSGIVRPLFNGQDLTGRARGAFLIDFGTLPREAAQRADPIIYGIVESRVKPTRDANPNRDIRERWWQLGHLRAGLREGLADLDRFIVTPETTKNRFFQFLPTTAAPDGSLFCIASDEAAVLGVLSSTIHILWVNAAAGKLGVGNDARYNKACFDAFPFPGLPRVENDRIADVATRISMQREQAIMDSEQVTMTDIYNIIAKLRSGARLTTHERTVHDLAGCSVLRDLHDQLDIAVASSYGWVWPLTREEVLDRLVALHDKRLEEENEGRVEWLRPSFQEMRLERAAGPTSSDEPEELQPSDGNRPLWPQDAVAQLSGVRQLAAARPITVDEAVDSFRGAPRELVARHFETLAMVGEVHLLAGGRYAAPN